jgi:hypothetical protein
VSERYKRELAERERREWERKRTGPQLAREMGDPPRRRHKQKFGEIEAIVKGVGV